jgi:hypothetical protein
MTFGQQRSVSTGVAFSRGQNDVDSGEIDTAHPGYFGSQDTFYVTDHSRPLLCGRCQV